VAYRRRAQSAEKLLGAQINPAKEANALKETPRNSSQKTTRRR
jgi:hypothetical protein